ncbi:hypothetical protein LSUB1_G003701 [Lachnellula subtilissima]|uniref:Uncharacterized protein n=1 Tax=Lachnellula subtilissima TaxID=602034 RepID=A0A8H8UEU7_9HELO|nr:hypothetical protein LSUB1_G003701 [Lachnellula subtilissima]
MASDLPSSNPFRRKGHSAAAAPPAPAAPENPSFEQISYKQVGSPPWSGPPAIDAPKKITKKVRVQSPPPPSPLRLDSASTTREERFPYSASAKPPTPIPRDVDPFYSIESDTSEDEASSGPSRVPANPFSKTLETMERPGGLSGREIPTVPPTNVSSPGRASLDVEAFKRLLMTGNAGLGISTATPPTQAHVAQHALGDGGSSTDASSVSRQSIFEAIQETHAESPRTSHEISDPDDDRRGLATETQSLTSGRKKPPPPSSRHGKSINVELRDEPTASTVQPPSTPGSITSQNYFTLSPVNSNRSQTDLNKPLPPAPNRASHDSDQESVFDKEAAGRTPEPPSPSSSIRKKTPPAPPLARRHSQLVSDSKLTRSGSGRLSPRVEEDNVSIAGSEYSGRERSNSGKVPPPPPSRRPPSIRSSSQNLPVSSPSATSIPTPPPARGSSRHSMSGRPPSLSSLDLPTSNKRASVVPPPPPPHRHGWETPTQSQSPGALRRASGEKRRRSIDNARPRRDSEASSVSQVEIIESNPGSDNILADLSTLQREIDALRSQSAGERVT